MGRAKKNLGKFCPTSRIFVSVLLSKSVERFVFSRMRGTRQSAPEYSLSLKKPQIAKKKVLTPLKLGPKKTVLIIAFKVALKLYVKIVWFGRQVAVCVPKRHKNAILGCSWFQEFNFDCLMFKLLICSLTTENI